MNLEGAVALGFAKELAKAREGGGAAAEEKLYNQLLAAGYERGGALSVARTLETDDVIDPAESRAWVAGVLEATDEQVQGGAGWRRPAGARKRPCISPW